MNTNISKSAHLLREMINKAIDNHKLTRYEYDTIINLASEDGVVDEQERALLAQLHAMLDDRSLKIVNK
jgi:hypothetical protein